jgi:hypothetical protein
MRFNGFNNLGGILLFVGSFFAPRGEKRTYKGEVIRCLRTKSPWLSVQLDSNFLKARSFMHFVFASKIAVVSCAMLLVLAACDSASSGAAATAAPSIATAEPTASAAATPTPVPAPSATPVPAPTAPPPSSTPAPTAPPPSNTPAPPTATLAPLEANTIPDDGEFDDELPFNTTANDPAVGSNSGDGIANVTFQFFGPDGNEVYRHTENNTLYCAFGGGDNGQDCDRWIFSEHQNQWPNGNLAQSGPHTIVVTIHGVRAGTARNERHATLNLNLE